MSVIKIANLTRDYGNGKGIFQISFRVEEGEIFGFLGPNGAGKTTTIRHLMGFLRPQSGKCRIAHLDCWKERDRIQEFLGYIPGEMNFFEDMTGWEFLNFCARYRGLREPSREKELMDRFEVDPRGKIRKMSKGMRQKLGIVTAFSHDPRVLILDEPTSGLDPLMQNRFVELLREEKQRGKTILLSSHMFEEVERTCDRVGIIREGRLATVDTIDTLRKRHMRTYTVTLDNPKLARAFARDFGGSASGNKARVTAKQSLESIFLHYYGGKRHD